MMGQTICLLRVAVATALANIWQIQLKQHHSFLQDPEVLRKPIDILLKIDNRNISSKKASFLPP